MATVMQQAYPISLDVGDMGVERFSKLLMAPIAKKVRIGANVTNRIAMIKAIAFAVLIWPFISRDLL